MFWKASQNELFPYQMVADELMKAILQETEITLLGSTKTAHSWKYQVKLSRESNFAALAGSLLKTLEWGMRISFRESLSPSDQFGRLKRWKVYLPKLNQKKPMQADAVFCRILWKIRFFKIMPSQGPLGLIRWQWIFILPWRSRTSLCCPKRMTKRFH